VRPRLFAHRGAPAVQPENTLPSFAAGLSRGADRLELDVHATRDGTVVVLHDERVDRTTNGRGLVRSQDLADVQALDAGWGYAAPDGSRPHRGGGIRIPTLLEVLETFPNVPVNVEIKQRTPPIVDRVLDVLDARHARERTLLAAEHHDILEHIRAAAPDVLTSFSALEVADFIDRLREGRLDDYRPAAVALQVPPTFGEVVIVSRESVVAAHALGLEVHVWTINDATEMARLLTLGVDAIMTDDPAIAAPVLARFRDPHAG
jgi:glycerophosphoryl diester phosphodiesterase